MNITWRKSRGWLCSLPWWRTAKPGALPLTLNFTLHPKGQFRNRSKQVSNVYTVQYNQRYGMHVWILILFTINSSILWKYCILFVPELCAFFSPFPFCNQIPSLRYTTYIAAHGVSFPSDYALRRRMTKKHYFSFWNVIVTVNTYHSIEAYQARLQFFRPECFP